MQPLRKGKRRRESGHILVTVAIACVALLGFVGLAIDVGYLEHQKRRMQTAADAGAMAGAQELLRDPVDTRHTRAIDGAKADSALNHFTDGTDGTVVTVNHPPTSGRYNGDANAVEVIVAQPQPAFFMKVLNFTTSNVSARAVGHLGSGQGCLYSLNPTKRDAVVISGTADATLNCAIMVNSNDSRALNANGGGSIDATSIGVVGGYSGTSSNFSPLPTQGLVPASDPLADLKPPTFSGCDHTAQVKITTDTTLSPGVYCGGIAITGGNVTFASGTYILNGGGMKISGSGNITGTGTTFFNTGTASTFSPIDIAGTGAIKFTAPLNGDLEGILFFQDRTLTPKNTADYMNNISGGAGSQFFGVMYFPTTGLSFTGTSDQSGGNIAIIADTVKLAGTVTFGGDFSALPGGSPIKMAVLGE